MALPNDQSLAEAAPNQAPAAAGLAKIKNKRQRRLIAWLIILLLLFGGYFSATIFLFPKPALYGEVIDANQPADATAVKQNILLATTTAASRSQAIAESENFKMLQINLEGSGTNIFDFGESELLTLSNIASELYSTKAGDKTEIRAAISCQTSRRAYLEVEYFKSGEKNKKTYKESAPSFNHLLVIPALEPDSVYKYSLSATDLNQTKIYSEQFVFYTGAGNISLVDVLGSAVQKVFGWAIGK